MFLLMQEATHQNLRDDPKAGILRLFECVSTSLLARL